MFLSALVGPYGIYLLTLGYYYSQFIQRPPALFSPAVMSCFEEQLCR